MIFPGNKRFAFTVFDDTDLSTVENVSPIYRLLAELGMHTTKSVWPLASVPGARFGGSSLQDSKYRDFILQLKEQGFEIALHNVRNHDAQRELVEEGFEIFRDILGDYPRAHANHSSNRENIYWGAARFSRAVGVLYRLATRSRGWPFEGHVEDSPYFWGDICRSRVEYVRNLVFSEINLNRINPSMPYHDQHRPYVNLWFSASNGPDAATFCATLGEANQDRLEAESGVCIMYTHFACGFCGDGKVEPRVEQLLRRLANKNGWFVPVSTLLDYLRTRHGSCQIPAREMMRMEMSWLAEGVRRPCWRIRTAMANMHARHD